MKLAEYGEKINVKEELVQKVLTEDDYMTMRTYMLEKIGSWTTKYLAPDIPKVEESSKSSGKKGSKKAEKPLSKAEIIVKANTQKLLIGDIDTMRINDDMSVSEIKKWHQPASLLIYLVYWGLHVIHVLKGKLKVDSKIVTVSNKIALDCYMSLYRASKDLANISPPLLLADAQVIDELLSKLLASKVGNELLGLLVTSHPELISDTYYDTVKPKNICLYEEQQKVLQLLHDSIALNKPLLIGYQVPPSGGKTILSVAIAAMLSHKFRTTRKRLLYICYNTLVRKAVANACAQAGVCFWVASSRQVAGADGPVSAMRPSNSCLNMNRRAKRERYMQAVNSGFKNKEGPMDKMLERAESLTIHHCPIIVADLASAIILLDLYPDDFVVYVDGMIV